MLKFTTANFTMMLYLHRKTCKSNFVVEKYNMVMSEKWHLQYIYDTYVNIVILVLLNY